ncbi:MAG TPA: FAD-dependent monooxygenase [Jatrophihabitans sp.]|nr:FAD-dependent monooxygenase [Jatrophihabitans sp.]
MAGPELVPGADCDVLVVGAGPTGLLAACELLRRGVRVRIVDRAAEPSTVPKALSLWPRALDILAEAGLGEEIRQSSQRIDAFSYYSDRTPLARFTFTPDLASRILPQPVTERLLRGRLHELGGKIERRVRLLALDEQPDGVHVLLEHPDGGLERTRVPFVAGADGATSTVRGQIGSGFAGSTYERSFALVDTRIEGELPDNEVQYFQAPSGTLVIVPAPDGVFRFLTVLPPTVAAIDVPMMQAVLDDRGPGGVRIAEPVWQTIFRVHARHATQFRRGRVFLLGDAAHVHSPAGGQGLNNGLQDAHNLGWKLAAVVHGESPMPLLDSYEPERQTATRRIVRDTDVQTRAWMVKGRAQLLARDAAFRLLDTTGAVSRWYAPVMAGRRLAYPPTRPAQQPARTAGCGLVRRRPTGLRIGAVFPRPLLPVAAGDEPPGWLLAVLPAASGDDWLADPGWLADRRSGLDVVRLAPAAGRELGCRRPGFYLVRPDGHLAAHGHAEDLDRLRDELDRALTITGRELEEQRA